MFLNLNRLFSNLLIPPKTPKFWEKDGIIPQLLLPLTVIYFIIKRLLTQKNLPKNLNCKVITIGNPIAGGAGKTPLAIAIFNSLRKESKTKKICFITKGYGGLITGPQYVDLNNHDTKQAGDEPLILAKIGDTIISKDRLKGIEFAEAEGFEIVITDDGLHDERFDKALNIAVIDGKYGLGNRLVLPSGPLRDRIDLALENTKYISLIGDDENDVVNYIKNRTSRDNFEVINCKIKPTTKHDKDKIYLAFAGIARPSKFFTMLKDELGLYLAETIEFADHHNYTEEDIEHLTTLAKTENATLITTEKDYVKLDDEFKKQVEFVKIKTAFEDQKQLSEILKKFQ